MIEILQNNEYLNSLINICKSNSGYTGAKLRQSHYELGKYLALNSTILDYKKKSTIISLARAGLPFSFGIADVLDSSLLVLDEKDSKLWANKLDSCNEFIKKNMSVIDNRNIIIVDAVIHTGKTLCAVAKEVMPYAKQIIIATNVIQNNAINLFNDYRLYAVRSSFNSFKGKKILSQIGEKGPDTGDRLFNTI